MNNHQRGFTLLEVMLAIAIFSALSFLASMVFSQASEQHQRAQKLANDFHALQYTLLLLENDLMQYVPRKNRQTHQPLTSETDELLFRTQMRDATTPFEASFVLTTIHWYVKDGTLYRAVRYSPDGKEDKPARALLTNIIHFSSVLSGVEGNMASTTVAITLERENKESVLRRFILPGWIPEKQQTDQHREDKK
ncbi:prepilin-type N-terminal cleavage/methylation domain-containing protein [Enterobacter cloacae]|uniref:PulJ/GspJ family protein n=1 Tax=Enterobacter cloacae TaxID=550 RepID=UPI002B1E8D17|nr:prepilin-type N-terminal cleavage/methylation domain-containing protein [Enterobacter cloacae]MEA3724240.1 prepilin-type N-terminal cleavage/methylation domain-containing protein [Enterobacter cloacae]MEA3729249.1 prepilin-type N-terminal cleavage/methylation domain-containing protein [Enterobacter cloacae]MEA3738706.1 prepilin-type N-terminal cleavage/methylation domain-containing protein [Enterobacter cloacae]MEA3752303.1 prepilin-type N-terminal cleavage/methylation domain-containing prot